jgi:hypothetical protein
MFRGLDFLLILSICSARLTKHMSVLDQPCGPAELGFCRDLVLEDAVECATFMLQIPFAPACTCTCSLQCKAFVLYLEGPCISHQFPPHQTTTLTNPKKRKKAEQEEALCRVLTSRLPGIFLTDVCKCACERWCNFLCWSAS